DQGEDFELACRDAEGALAGGIGRERFECGGFRLDKYFSHDDCFADGFAAARDAEAEPDAEGREEDSDERAVELDGVLDDDEAVFGVLEGGDEKAADEAEDENVTLHDGVAKKYISALPMTSITPQSSANAFLMGRSLAIQDRVSPPAQVRLLTWSVDEADDPVFAPAIIVEFGTGWIGVPPSGCGHDLIFRNALADQRLLDPIRPLRR